MNCFSCQRSLSAYIDDELAAETRQEVESHLDGCQACRDEYESHAATLEALDLTRAEAAPDSLWPAVEGQLGAQVESTGIEDLALMLRGLAAQVQDLQRSVDGLRQQMTQAQSEPAAWDDESIQVPSGPYRSVRPRASSIEQLRDNPFRQRRRS